VCGLNLTLDGDIQQMNWAIQHRGIRSSIAEHGPWKLGHVRLPINELSESSDQPIQQDGWSFLFVGEFFDWKKFDPYATCDTHVLVGEWLRRVWEGENPTNLFKDIDWMGAFIAIDPEDCAHIIQDYLAQKPLYIHEASCTISSEIRGVMAGHVNHPWPANDFYLGSVAKFGYHPGPDTMIQGIQKMPHATYTTIDPGDSNDHTIRRSSKGTLRPRPGNIRKLLEESMKKRLISDQPLAMLVSGGLDSSIVYKLTEQAGMLDQVKVFHCQNGEEQWLDELGVKNTQMLECQQVKIEDAIWLNEGPVDLGSLLPQIALARAMSGSPVVLTGDGADELFGGYRRMAEYDAQLSDIFQELVYYHLPRLDKIPMSHTTELRTPFLARPVIEAALALPYAERIEKRALKAAFQDLIPETILNRPKQPLKSARVLFQPMEWRMQLIDETRRMIQNEMRDL